MDQKEQSKTARVLRQIEAARINPATPFSIHEMKVITGLGRASIYGKARSGVLPRQVAPGRWNGGEVLAWQTKRFGGVVSA